MDIAIIRLCVIAIYFMVADTNSANNYEDRQEENKMKRQMNELDLTEITFVGFWDTLDDAERENLIFEFYDMVQHIPGSYWGSKFEQWFRNIAEARSEKVLA